MRGSISTTGSTTGSTPGTTLDRCLLFLAGGAVVALAAGCGDGLPDGRARRVILISCDTLRADRLGVYGYGRPTSPNVDRFAEECVVFDEAYSSAPMTGPALSSLFSGLLPDEVGVAPGNLVLMPSEVVTLGELARDAGYPTAAVVSNFVLRRPDPSLGDVGVAQGFEHFDDHMTDHERNRPKIAERSAPKTTAAAIDWLAERHAEGQDRFFLWVHYQDPHGPYTPPDEEIARFARPPSDERVPAGKNRFGKGQIPNYQVLDGEQRADVYRDRYDAEIAYFDASFGRLVGWLAEVGWLDDALVVFTADHGESLGEHGYWFCHGENVYREVVRVPLVVRYPRGAPRPRAERVSDHDHVAALVGHLDLWPTVIEALGLPPHPNRGRSLFAEAIPADRSFGQFLRAEGAKDRWTGLACDGRRLVVPPSGTAELYDVRSDPLETQDLARTDVGELAKLSAVHAKLVGEQDLRHAGVSAPLNAQQHGQLAGLGYVDGADEHGDAPGAEEEHDAASEPR